jgi:ABC-type lipoprotein export system ATPase subunit
LIVDLFKERRAAGTTLVVVSHDSRLLPYATQTVELAAGKVVKNEEVAAIADSRVAK